jgi:hypothetical protein
LAKPNLGLRTSDQEKQEAIETIVREAKRLERLAAEAGKDMLGLLLANVQQETKRVC